MSFLKLNKNSVFDEDKHLVVLLVFFNRVIIFLLEKRLAGRDDVKYVISDLFVSECVDFDYLESICLNFRRNIENKYSEKFKNVIVALSSEYSDIFVDNKNVLRKSKNKKITNSEIDKIISKIKKDKSFKKFFAYSSKVEEILIDDYIVDDPIGSFGSEIKVRMSGALIDKEFKKRLDRLFLKLSWRLVGINDLNLTLINKESEHFTDAVFLNIFNNKIDIFVVKSKKIKYKESLHFGLDNFTDMISKNFKVGFSEADFLRHKFLNNSLDISVFERVRKIATDFSKDLLTEVKNILLHIDKNNILPKTILVSFSSPFPIQLEQSFRRGNAWFSDLPFPDDVRIIFLNNNFLKYDNNVKIKKLDDVYKLYIYFVIDDIIRLNRN